MNVGNMLLLVDFAEWLWESMQERSLTRMVAFKREQEGRPSQRNPGKIPRLADTKKKKKKTVSGSSPGALSTIPSRLLSYVCLLKRSVSEVIGIWNMHENTVLVRR